MDPEALASVRLVNTLHSTVLDLACELTNTRISLEQSIFALQEQVQSLEAMNTQLQAQLVQATQDIQAARFQAALARLEIQQMLERLEAEAQSD